MMGALRRAVVAWVSSAHAFLLRLYPRPFRAEFEGEMRDVFARAAAVAVARGYAALARLCLRELLDGPKALLSEYRSGLVTKRRERVLGATLEAAGQGSLAHGRGNMGRSKKCFLIAGAGTLALVQLAVLLVPWAWLYAAGQLRLAKVHGIYASPEEGMRVKCARNPFATVTQVEVVGAGIARHDGSHPHVHFVVAKVWAPLRPDGMPTGQQGYYEGGSYFVRVREGWVHIPEGRFPHFIGACMLFFGLS